MIWRHIALTFKGQTICSLPIDPGDLIREDAEIIFRLFNKYYKLDVGQYSYNDIKIKRDEGIWLEITPEDLAKLRNNKIDELGI